MKSLILFTVLGMVAAQTKILILHTNDMHSRWAGIDAEGGAMEPFAKSGIDAEGGAVESFAKSGIDAEGGAMEFFDKSKYGNLIRLKTVLNHEIANAENRHVLVLNAGDTFDGTPTFNVTGTENQQLAGKLTGKLINTIGFHALSLGNHEFDIDTQGLYAFLDTAGTNSDSRKLYLKDDKANIYQSEAEFLQDFPADLKVDFNDKNLHETKWPIFVAANYINNEIFPLYEKIKKSVVCIFEDASGNAVPIGIIGYLTRDTKKNGDKRLNLIDPAMTRIGDPVAYVEKESERLFRMGVKIIIALGHAGIDIDKQIAALPYISTVVGGHTNTFMFNHYGEPEADPGNAVLPYPTLVPKIDNAGNYYTFTPVVQAYGYMKYLGKLELDFDQNGKLLLNDHTNSRGALSTFTDKLQNPILLTGDIYSNGSKTIALYIPVNNQTKLRLLDTATYNILKKMINNLQTNYIEIMKKSFTWSPPATGLGKITRSLEGGEICRTRECELGGIIADSHVEWFTAKSNLASTPDYFNAVIGVINGGGVRGQIGDIFVADYNPKQISMYDLLQVLDLKINAVAIELTQEQLKYMFSIGISQWAEKAPSGRFLQVSSNVRLEINFEKMQPEMTIDEKIYSTIPEFRVFVKKVPGYQFVDVLHSDFSKKKFIVAADSHLADGRVGYEFMKGAPKLLDGLPGWCVLGDYFGKFTIGNYNSRIKFINDYARLEKLRT